LDFIVTIVRKPLKKKKVLTARIAPEAHTCTYVGHKVRIRIRVSVGIRTRNATPENRGKIRVKQG